MANQQGAMAIVFGVPNADITLGGQSLVGATIISNLGLTPTAKEVRTENEAGSTVNITTYDFGLEASFTVIPRGTTEANAITANGYFPAIGARCTVVNAATVATFTDTQFSASSAGREYRVKTASKAYTTSGVATWNLTIERVDSITSMAALA
jgi:hypothetical protein